MSSLPFKKRYIASPIIILIVAFTWNVVWQNRTPIATAEEIKPYIAPETTDTRHPIEVYQIGIDGGETQSDVLAQLPTVIYPEDRVTFVVDPGFGLGSVVHVARALPVTIKDGKREYVYRTWSNTVGELLADANRSLADMDKANFKNGDVLTKDMKIVITRVSKTTLSVKEVVEYKTIDKDDPSMYRRETKVSQQGENGERIKTYEVIREDGEEVSRKLVKTETTKSVKDKIVLHGTKAKIGKTASGKATWYDLCCKKVASNVFKKGTVLRLTNKANGKQVEVTVDDTGGFGSSIVVDLHPDYFKALGGTLGQGVISNVVAEEILNP
jgi:hypothetical protein